MSRKCFFRRSGFRVSRKKLARFYPFSRQPFFMPSSSDASSTDILHPAPEISANQQPLPGSSTAQHKGTGYFERLYSWYWPTSNAASEEAESKLLSRLRFFGGTSSVDTPESKSHTSVTVGLVDVGNGKLINTLVINEAHKKKSKPVVEENIIDEEGFGYTPGKEQTTVKLQRHESTSSVPSATSAADIDDPTISRPRNLVICHGFGAGLGFFYRNYHGLSQSPMNLTIYAIDWLSMGRSARVPLPKPPTGFKTREENLEACVKQTEDFFTDSLESWRKVHQIEKMTLLGHSLGGYLSAVYALKYPERVERLILVSPVGIPENPHMANTSASPAASQSSLPSGGQPSPVSTPAEYVKHRNRKLPHWVQYLWRSSYTPQYVVRLAGPWGPRIVQGYTNRRFAYLDNEDREALKNYIYHISASTGSGEYAMSRLLAPGAFAHTPLLHRLPALTMPTLFMYGDHDWMDSSAAYKVVKKMKEGKVFILPDAGHHLYLDNPRGFDQAVLNFMMEEKQAEANEK